MYSKKKRPLTPVDGNLCKGNKERKKKNIFQEFCNLMKEFKKTYDEVFSCEKSPWVTMDINESSELEDDVFTSKKHYSDNGHFLSPETIRQTSEVDETWSLDPISWSDDSKESRTEGPVLPHKEILHSTAINFNNKSPTHPISPYLEKLINFSSIYLDDSEINEDVCTINFDELFEKRKDQNSSSNSRLSHENSKQDQMKNALHSTKINSKNGSLPLSDLSSIRPNKKRTEKQLSSVNPEKIGMHKNLPSINPERNGIIIEAGNRNDSKKMSVMPQKSVKRNHKKNILHSTKSDTMNESLTLPFSPFVEELSFPPKNRNTKSKRKELSSRNPDKIGMRKECKNQNTFKKMEMPKIGAKRNRKKNILHSTKSNTLNESLTSPFSPCIEKFSIPPINPNKKSKHKELSAKNPDKIRISMDCENQNDIEKMPRKRTSIEV